MHSYLMAPLVSFDHSSAFVLRKLRTQDVGSVWFFSCLSSRVVGGFRPQFKPDLFLLRKERGRSNQRAQSTDVSLRCGVVHFDRQMVFQDKVSKGSEFRYTCYSLLYVCWMQQL